MNYGNIYLNEDIIILLHQLWQFKQMECCSTSAEAMGSNPIKATQLTIEEKINLAIILLKLLFQMLQLQNVYLHLN